MPNSLTSPPVRPLLDRLFQAADYDDAHRVTMRERHPDGFAGMSAREQADAYADLYIPVSPEGTSPTSATPARGYLFVSFPESDGLEITCRL